MSLSVYKYRLPFRKPFTISGDSFSHREGLLLEWKERNRSFYGEAAPLPGFSKESLEDAATQLQSTLREVRNLIEEAEHEDLQSFFDEKNICPSLRFALDTLFFSVKAGRKGITISHLLFDKPPSSFPVNAVLPIGSLQKTLESAAQKWNEGFKTFKIKVGTDSAKELEILQALRKTFPEVNLRIDANRAWNLQEAIDFLTACGSLNLEYCEEPLQHAQIQLLGKLKSEISVPIAFDESLHEQTDPETFLKTQKGEVIVIKPMLFGDFQKIFVTKRLADSLNYKVIFTSALESGIGRIMTATLASGLSATQTHGLATGNLLKKDVLYDRNNLDNGYFHLSDFVGSNQKGSISLKELTIKISEC